jgi:HEAT repeat protein
MAKVSGVDAKMNRLRAIRKEPADPAHVVELRGLLGDKSNFVVADAAEIVGNRVLTELASEMVAAFHRFLIDPVETDKLCRAKIAIVEALNKIEYDREDVFRAGLRHVQMEPSWGKPEDSAAPLRSVSAFALTRINPRDLLLLLSDLLADPEKVARSAAAKALGASGSLAAIPLLRFKARTGDEEPEVTVECLAALLSADPEGSIPFVGEFLDPSDEEIVEGAALALGESRRPVALELLKKRWTEVESESLQSVLLLSIAITRLPAGIDFLLDILANGPETAASAALAALAIHRHNAAVRERVAAIIAKNNVASLRKEFDKEFGKVD